MPFSLRFLLVLPLLALALLFGAPAKAQQFPALTGRVVDDAGMLDPASRTQLTRLSEAHEAATGNQIVIVTVNTLGGQNIAAYARALGNQWGIGQRGRNNGVILLIAKTERQTRIEVGGGLKAMLPDSAAQQIVDGTLTPAFRQGRFGDGSVAAIQAVTTALGGVASTTAMPMAATPGSLPAVAAPSSSSSGGAGIGWGTIILLVIGFFIARKLFCNRANRGGMPMGGGMGMPGGMPGSMGGFGSGFGGGAGGFMSSLLGAGVGSYVGNRIADGGLFGGGASQTPPASGGFFGGGNAGGGGFTPGGGGFGGGGGGGGFSGGGGDFGGGGASGDW